VETGFFAAILSLCNSLPFFYRVYKNKNTQSFSTYTLAINVFTGLIALIQFSLNYYDKGPKPSLLSNLR
jgi:uncharacterized protein with PQ loop repeat